MINQEIRKIVIIGAGRVARNLCVALRKKNYTILEVWNRSETKGLDLARKLKAKYIRVLEYISLDADLYILAVSDDAIKQILERLDIGDHLLVHTSGSVDMDILGMAATNFGVIYPLQTFRTDRRISFRNVPLCIEASSDENLRRLKAFTDSISHRVYKIDSDQRRVLHLSAVFASNFSNFMVAVSQDLLRNKGIDPTILEPLIKYTAENSGSPSVFDFQTGPAIREDMETIAMHLNMLSAHPDYKEIYSLITQNIIKHKKKI
ncbi:MAG: DUF2520 domain-containing protein [Bacteroidales bacterium]|jgi:predicted short-subunit dehydrogenase-like oxidoreductase (DUF2520 family)